VSKQIPAATLRQRYVTDCTTRRARPRAPHGSPATRPSPDRGWHPDPSSWPTVTDKLTDRDLLAKRYIVDAISVLDLAQELYVSRATLRKALDAAGIPRRRVGRQMLRSLLDDGDWLRRKDEIDNMSMAEIARETGLNASLARRALIQHGIPIRVSWWAARPSTA
jgi:DNA-binding phage protein